MITKQHSIRSAAAIALLAGAAAGAAEPAQPTEQAAHIAQTFMQTLGRTLQQTMKQEGPVAAIKVCSAVAPSIAGELSRQNGWRITRVGTRVRNPMLGMPDAWEQQVLTQFQARAAAGESFKEMSHAEIVAEPNGRYFRFMKAIGTQARCLTCHGPVGQIPAPVHAILKQQYPFDAATGYRQGDLRGAVSIKYRFERM